MLPPTPEKVPARRRRFQFSLRALLATVFAYGCLWLLTLKFGGATLARSYADAYREHLVKLDTSNSVALEIVPAVRSMGYIAGATGLRGIVRAPAPFILIWKWESKNAVDTEWQPVPNTDGFHFWWPGRKWPSPLNTPTFHYQYFNI